MTLLDRTDYVKKQNKLIYKIITVIKDSRNTAHVDKIYGHFLKMSDRETNKTGTFDPLIKDKNDLINILKALEENNSIMYSADD